jgi:U3 small nucleolar RNA-associated protein 5
MPAASAAGSGGQDTTVLAAFDASCESLAVLSGDGRLKLWDAMTGKLQQQYVEAEHLVQRYTSLAWGPVVTRSAERAGKKRSKKSRPNSRPTTIALGTSSGVTVVWDLVRAEVSHRLGSDGAAIAARHTAPVTDVVFSADGRILHTCAEDKRVLSWEVTSGGVVGKPLKTGKSAPSRMAVSADGAVLAVGGLQIKLWDVASRKTTRRLSGHALPVTCLAFAADGALLVSGCGDRYLRCVACSSAVACSPTYMPPVWLRSCYLQYIPGHVSLGVRRETDPHHSLCVSTLRRSVSGTRHRRARSARRSQL